MKKNKIINKNNLIELAIYSKFFIFLHLGMFMIFQ